jgi:hypothetical protein
LNMCILCFTQITDYFRVIFICEMTNPPARNPMSTGMNFYPQVWVQVRISTRSLFAGGWVIGLPNPNLTRCHPYLFGTTSLHKTQFGFINFTIK